MAVTPVPLTILRARADETLRRLALALEIEHPGESGRAREQMLIAFIEQLIPSSFGVSTGFVVDALGGKSRQVDVVVYRTDYAPLFEIGGVKHFLVESVVAVLEVKAAIDSNADLTQALDNIASVKALDRTNRGRNKVVTDRIWIPGQYAERERHTDQVFGAIVTEKSLARDFREDFLAWLTAHPRYEWPNIYVDVHQFTAFYGWMQSLPDNPESRVVGPEAMRAASFAISRPDDPNAQPPLLVLGVELIDWFRRVPTIDFSTTDYLWLDNRLHETWDLTDTDKAGPGE
jgi:hypothetical protein